MTTPRLNTHLKLMVVCIAACHTAAAFALQSMDDRSLSDVTGADGISIQNKADRVDMTTLKWQDNVTSNAKKMELQTLAITKDSTGAIGLDSTLQLNVGADSSNVPALNISLTSEKSFMTAGKMVINSVDATGTATTTNDSLGELAVEMPNQTKMQLTTTGGLFSATGTASVSVLLDSMNVYITKKDAAGKYNQLVLADVRANIGASGKIWVDATQGIVFNGSLDAKTTGWGATSTATTNSNAAAGVQINLMHRGDVGGDGALVPHSYSISDSKTGGLISFGFSGKSINDTFSIRGTNESRALNASGAASVNPVGGMVNSNTANSVIGDRGIAMNYKGENADDNTSFQLGEAGSNGNGLRFTQFRDFTDVTNSSKHGLFDFGNVYINLSNTTYLALPDALGTVNASNKLLTTKSSSLASTLLTQADFAQSALSAKDAMVMMIRGTSFQMIPEKTIFINNTGATAPTNAATSWSFMTLINNMNGNIALYGVADTSKIGFSFAASTQGSDNPTGTTTKTTSIGLINTGACDSTSGAPTTGTRGTACNQFIGLRNIDLLSKGQGTLQVQTDRIRIDLDNFLLAVDADVTASYLPKALLGDGSTMAWTAAALKNDKLFGLRMKVDASSGYVELIPGLDVATNNKKRALGINAELLLRDGGTAGSRPSMLQIVDGPTNTTIGLEQISGRLAVSNGYIDVLSDAVEMSGIIKVNPANLLAEDLRIRELNLYPNGDSASKQTFGEMAIAGGQIYARMKLTPR